MRVRNVDSVITQPVYDTVQMAAVAAQTVNFFTIPRNQAIAGAVLKSYAHTNLNQAGILEKGNSLEVTGISMWVRPFAVGGAHVIKTDYEAIYNNGFIQFDIGATTFLYASTAMIPAGAAEVQYLSNITPAATEFSLNHGFSSMNNLFMLPEPIELSEVENFRVDLTVNDTLAAVTDVSICLWGNLVRPGR